MDLSATILLREHHEKLSQENPWSLTPPPLYHQWRTVEALRDHDLVVNTYNTGTGKTTAALLRLLEAPTANTLFIAPTNELIRQHVEAARRFVADNALDLHVLGVDASVLRRLADAERETNDFSRNAQVLHDLIQNSRRVDPTSAGRRPFVLVTNPDLFYLALYGAYSQLDTRNLLTDFITRFDYLVVDEFHYYNAKQLACFLFFFALSQEFGYFDGTRKVCLLSATPNDQLRSYLTELFGERWTEVSPGNEPDESRDLSRTKALTDLDLTLRVGSLEKLFGEPETVSLLRNRIASQDGVIVSDSLARISRLGAQLRRSGFTPDEFGAIVGPARREAREQAKKRPLLLATPTVDIGYNFDRLDKPRQPLDFVYCEAPFAPELVQRIGRAGRVLGKVETDIPSEAVALVPDKLLTAVQQTGKTVFTRPEFASLAAESLGEDNRLFAYLDSWAVLESYRPIHEMKRIMPPDWDAPERLFERVRRLFAPASAQTAELCEQRIRAHLNRERLLQAERKGEKSQFVDRLWHTSAVGYLRHEYRRKGEPDGFERLSDQKRTEAVQWALRRWRPRVRDYVESRHALLSALFRFRGDDVGLRCGIHDPQRLFQSGADHCYYDLLHVLEHYDFTLLDWRQFSAAIGERPEWCDCYVRVDQFRSPRGRVGFTLNAMDTAQEEFDREHWGHPTALKGLRLRLTYRAHGQDHEIAIPPEVRRLTEERYLPCLVTRFADRGALQGYLGARRLMACDLLVDTSDAAGLRYQIVLGTAAFAAHAELWARWRARKAEEEAVAVCEAFDEATEDDDRATPSAWKEVPVPRPHGDHPGP